jgi:uncharacterized membrane protein
MIATHNLLDPLTPDQFGSSAWLWGVLHVRGPVQILGVPFEVGYPLIPWIGVMAAGYGLGAMLLRDPARRSTRLMQLGAAMVAAFVMLRATNLYGDPSDWAVQSAALFTVFSFVNATKYPPSLVYLLMTLGPMLLVLGAVDRRLAGRTMPAVLRPMVVLGRVPMFYYVLHLYLIHALALLIAYFEYGRLVSGLVQNPPFPGMPAGYGYDLWVTYAVWLLVVMALYPLCAWFAGVKKRRKDWWLSYL